MKLSTYDLIEPLEFNDGGIYTLVIENPRFFRDFVSGLLNQSNKEESKFILSDELKILDFTKNVEIISDLFSVSFDSKGVMTKITQQINEESQFFDSDILEIITRINALAAKVADKLEFDTDFNELTDISGIIKLLGFSVDYKSMTLPERILQYIDLFSKYFNKKLFILVSLKSILDEAELKEFAKAVEYRKIDVLLLESYSRDKFFPNEKVRIIDKDLCEF